MKRILDEEEYQELKDKADSYDEIKGIIDLYHTAKLDPLCKKAIVADYIFKMFGIERMDI